MSHRTPESPSELASLAFLPNDAKRAGMREARAAGGTGRGPRRTVRADLVGAACVASVALGAVALAAGKARAQTAPNAAPPAAARPAPAAPAAPAPAAPARPRPAAAKQAQPKKKADETPKLPDAPARLWVVAPSPTGPWTLRIDNEGDRPLRIPADVRLLRLDVEVGEGRKKKKLRCAAPPGMRPESFPEARALLLPPGHSYIETFDPHLLCFGTNASALTGGALVRARFGWESPPSWSKKAPKAPFAADGTDDPAVYAPLRELRAPAMLLSFAPPAAPASPPPSAASQAPNITAPAAPSAQAPGSAAPIAPPQDSPPAEPPSAGAAAPSKQPKGPEGRPSEAPKPEPQPAIVDAKAARLEIEAQPYAEAPAPGRVAISVQAKNAGQRPLVVVLRPRMLAFHVEGAESRAECPPAPPSKAIPRDLYRNMDPGDAVSLGVVLAEVCPPDAFPRQGLYRVTPVLHANERGTEVGLEAWVGDVAARAPTLVRLATAPEPYYDEPPRAVPTPKPPPGDDGDPSP